MIDLPPLDFPKPAIIRPAPDELLRYGGDPMLSIHPSVPSPAAAVGKKAASFPVIEGFNTNSGNDFSGSITINLPSGIVSGEKILIYLAVGGAGSGSNWTISGYTRIGNVQNGAALQCVYERVADGSEGATVNTNGNSIVRSHASIAQRISNAGTVYHDFATGSSTGPDSPSLDPGIGVNDFLWISTFSGASAANAGATVTSGPSNYDDVLQDAANSGSGGNRNAIVGSAHRNLSVASENPGAFTISASRDWIARTIAIAPA